MGYDIVCDTNLALSIGYYGDDVLAKRGGKDYNKKCDITCLDLSLKNQGEEAIDDMEDDNVEGFNNSIVNKNNNSGVGKKLRLTIEQTNFLEERFKCYQTINTTQKQVIAATLNLKPRQVEVWFQNRRARTKLKKIEVDCEFMKKCCDSLSEENRRLKRELQELRSLKFNQQPSALFLQLSKASKRASSTEKIYLD